MYLDLIKLFFKFQVCLKYYEHEFVELACQCPAVVVCRCSPTQKADIVNLLKTHTGKRTCAVGDGGNDVSMIQAADAGIGIVGKVRSCFGFHFFFLMLLLVLIDHRQRSDVCNIILKYIYISICGWVKSFPGSSSFSIISFFFQIFCVQNKLSEYLNSLLLQWHIMYYHLLYIFGLVPILGRQAGIPCSRFLLRSDVCNIILKKRICIYEGCKGKTSYVTFYKFLENGKTRF